LGSAPTVVGQEQNSLVAVFNWAWISNPMTGSISGMSLSGFPGLKCPPELAGERQRFLIIMVK
jgi:hypothetical protein